MQSVPKYTSEEIDAMIIRARAESADPIQIVSHTIDEYKKATQVLLEKYLVNPSDDNTSYIRLIAIVQGMSLAIVDLLDNLSDPFIKRQLARSVDQHLGQYLRDVMRG